MWSKGFAYNFSDVVTLDTLFPFPSIYIYVNGGAGDIVYRNTAGSLQWTQAAGLGYHPIGATEIVSSGTVNGTPRTTTATGLIYCSTSGV